MTRKYLMAIGLLIAVLMGCESDPTPLELSQVEELEATVIAVDAQARTLVLRGPDGNDVRLNVGPDVRNLSQVEIGNVLHVSYYRGLLVSIAEPGEAGEDLRVVAGRADEGDLPGALVGATTRATVEILSVAPDGKAVSFRDPGGRLQSIEVPREEGQAFARKLRPGDLVDIQYTEAIAIGVEPAESGG